MSTQPLLIEISQEPIPLCQLLKIANLVSGGGEAKIVISEGYVLLNNEVEYQKRKKIFADDIVEFNGDILQVVVTVAQQTPNKKPKVSKAIASKPITSKQVKPETTTMQPEITKKRKPISF
jgi:ribosome-associated protein